MGENVTAVEVVEGPDWRTLKGLEAPLRVWGEWHEDHFRTAGDRKQPTGEPVVMVRLWSEQRGTARYAETQDGRTVSLGGAATKFWVQAGAGEAPAVEEPEAVEEAPVVEVVEEAPAVEEPVRYFAEFESVKAAPGHQEMRLTIRARGERDAVEYYALTYVPGWTAEGFCRVFGWSPVVGELEYVGMSTERGEVERTDASGTPSAMAARMAVRDEILARFTVRLATGAAGHFRAAFRLGQAYPIGWTYRVGYGEGAFFQAVTAGGALVCTAGVATREEAEEQLKAHDPAAPATNDALRAYVMELAGQKLGRAFLAARNDDLTALPDELTANAPITVQEARDRIARTHGMAEEFQPFQGEGGRFLGWTFRCGRLHSSRYGWITARGTLTQALEPYRSVAGNVLVHADRDDQEAAERAVVARSMTGRKLAANRCVHHRYTRSDVQGDPVLACETRAPGETFGLFTVEGLDQTHECAVEVANEAARMGGWDTDVEGAEPLPYWAKTCPTHREGVAGRCALCGQDTPDEDAEEAPAPRFVAGDLVVCADGVRRTVEGMAPRVTGEPERVIVEGGEEWIADNCRRANRDDLHAARVRSSVAAELVRTDPDSESAEWREALKELAESLDFLKHADPLYAHLREEEAKEAVRTVHPDAHTFQPFHNPADPVPVAGWTFRTGHSSSARYGVVSAACQLSSVGLYEYRTTAERAFLHGQDGSAGRS